MIENEWKDQPKHNQKKDRNHEREHRELIDQQSTRYSELTDLINPSPLTEILLAILHGSYINYACENSNRSVGEGS